MQFNTLQELWNYCLQCPVCHQNGRTMSVSVGPDAVFNLNYWHQDKTTLLLQCEYYHKAMVYSVEYTIDCSTNSFNINVSLGKTLTGFTVPSRNKINEAYFYFYIQGICDLCGNSASYGNDIELDMLNKLVANIGIESESALLIHDQDRFSVSLFYDSDKILVSKQLSEEDINSIDLTEDNCIELPMVKMDLGNAPKSINKIKTMILFS